MKRILTIAFVLFSGVVNAQKIEKIFVNLYTDSLKKGTYNYINIDGLLPNGRYLPLDTTEILFTASAGRFYGNNLFVDKDFREEKITIKAMLKKNSSLYKEFDMFIKKKPDDENLKTVEELLNGSQPPKPKRKKG